MSYQVQLSLTNTTNKTIKTIIYGGTIFEVDDPFSQVQNLVAIQDTPITIPVGGSSVIEIETWCMNRNYRSPQDSSMRLTPLTLDSLPKTQGELWESLAKRK
jgi:hypothetical protein